MTTCGKFFQKVSELFSDIYLRHSPSSNKGETLLIWYKFKRHSEHLQLKIWWAQFGRAKWTAIWPSQRWKFLWRLDSFRICATVDFTLSWLLWHLSLRETIHSCTYLHRTITPFIIWQAPQAGKMNQIPCCDWLPEQARWSNIARFILTFRLCRCTKVFSLKIFSVTVKRFSVISLSGWN